MRTLAACLAFILAIAPALAAELAPSDRIAIRAVIEGQLAAFRREDSAAAIAYASPGIQAIFKDPETFMAMVRQDYQPVYRPKAVSFRDIASLDGNPVQPVSVVGPTGLPMTALYIMERQKNGDWRIGGCVLVAQHGNSI